MYFYLIQCENKNTDFLEGNYVHIKAKTDGLEIAAVSEVEIIHENVISKTQEELQTLIDDWIDAENIDPPDENLQSVINIEGLLDV